MKFTKRLFCLLWCVVVVLTLLAACSGQGEETQPATVPTEASTPSATVPEDVTVAPTVAPTEASTPSTPVPTEETVAPTVAPTEPTHSALYIPGVDVEDVIVWFREVCLAAEFVNSGDPSFLQKWDTAIYYCVQGSPTEEDLNVLDSFAQWLNTVEGFPGIYETTNPQEGNLHIYFCSDSEMVSRMGEWTLDLDGAVTFWYDGYNSIYDGTICIRTDLRQNLRNSVILEELYNGLGPVQDTAMRPDSLIYAEFSEPQDLTEIDKLILYLLYHPDMKCGMSSAQCEEVIRKLYY